MKTRISISRLDRSLALVACAFVPLAGVAQVPVDENGTVIGTYENQALAQQTGNEDIPLLSLTELEELVGPIALYPDDLVAIVLPAATYPLQIVQAARFLDDLESDPGLKPNPDWDDSVVALTNYPEVVELLNEDLDWTWRLGEAVVAQQADVVGAVESFRNRAYAAGNLKSDNYQNVTSDEGIIEITPVNEEVIYVPYYEPRRVVVYQPRPVYYYYPRPCPVYYYPYPSGYAFNRGYFWGVTTAFSIGWTSDHLRVFHHSYRGHPYYGHSYWDRWWYRRPTINVHNTVYINNRARVANRYVQGDFWQSSRDRHLRFSDQRITRSTHYPSRSNTPSVHTLNPATTVSTRRQPSVSNNRTPPATTIRQANRTPVTVNRQPAQRRLAVPEVNDRGRTSVSTYARQEPAQRRTTMQPAKRDIVRHTPPSRQTQRTSVTVSQQPTRRRVDRTPVTVSQQPARRRVDRTPVTVSQQPARRQAERTPAPVSQKPARGQEVNRQESRRSQSSERNSPARHETRTRPR